MSVTTEDYLKRIFIASEGTDRTLIGLGEVASALGVTPGTVTTMMKSLSDAGLVDYRPRSGVVLTDTGRREALDVLRRHRLVELFLVEVLKLDWAEVHEEAEVLEHAVSDRLLRHIDELLGHPTTDPHGDPIPAADGSIVHLDGPTLAEVPAASTVHLVRVKHGDAGFLGFLKGAGLIPGAAVDVVERDTDAGTVTVSVGGERRSLSFQVAERLRVEVMPAARPRG